jgi:lipid-A-disaccharide synthase
MLCILPFEERFYEGTGVSARFVGHPFAERALPGDAAGYRQALGLPSGHTLVALLPGSRHSEIDRILPPMLDAAERIRALHPDVQFVIPVAPTLREEALRPALSRHADLTVHLVAGRADEAVGASDAALVKSGTATLETALMNRPMVVVYKMAWLTYWLGRMLVHGVTHFALVNLLAGRTVVPELLQSEASPERMAAEIERLLSDPVARRTQLDDLAAVRRSLGEPGAGRRVAEEIERVLT